MAKLPTYQSLKVTVAVSCVQSAISLEAETLAFFFSAWSKHVLTASHSILKHPQLGADEDIKKTHPKHLHQATEKFYCYLLIYLTAAPSLLFSDCMTQCSWQHTLYREKIAVIYYTNILWNLCSNLFMFLLLSPPWVTPKIFK